MLMQNQKLRRLNKRAQIFTLIGIALTLLFFVTYSIYSILNERTPIKTRINTMDSFLFSIEKNLERQLYISGFRTIFLAEDYIGRTGNTITNFSELFEEAINNGTIYGEESSFLQGTTITEIQENIMEKAGKMNLEINFSNSVVKVKQEDPWSVSFYLNFTLNLTDKSGMAYWYKNETIRAEVSIMGFEDPLFLINTQGKVSRKINKTIYEGNYVEGSDVTNLTYHLEEGYYAANPNAPSFIKRLEGKVEGDENGIESFVYIPDLSQQGIPIKEKSLIDYVYFSSSNPASYKVSGMPSWFRIDSSHVDKYQVGNLIE